MRQTSLVAVTDESVESESPVPMANVYTFEQLVEQAKKSGGVASDGSLGIGAEPIASSELVGVPFVVVAAHINEGDYDDDYVSLECKLADGRLVVLNDGGKGVANQFIEKDPNKDYGIRADIKLPMYVPHGLRVSEYALVECPKCKTVQPARSRRKVYLCRVPDCGQEIQPNAPQKGKGETYYVDTAAARG